MCGIAGFYSLCNSRDNFDRNLNCMINKLEHRGPDHKATWFDLNSGIALGHNRLSIIELSEYGHQPMISYCKKYVIIFNGEIYNHKLIRSRLPKSIRWRGNSDTETLINAISFWGLEKTLSNIVGMFAFAIWDRNQEKLTLVRDRLGEKPLYFGYKKNTMLFSSEIKSIEAFPETSFNIDRNSLEQYLRFGYIQAPNTIYEGIYKLPPGNLIEFSKNDIREGLIPKSSKYWSFELITKQQESDLFLGSDIQAIDQLENLLKNSISGQLLADVPVGAFLSGGIDSSTVVSIMQNQSSNPINTFTIGFEEFEYDESKSARKVASYLGTNHKELFVSPDDALSIIPKLSEVYDEPFADVSQIPTFLISKFASENVKVCLSGDGGDELFCGYSRHSYGPKIWHLLRKIPFSLRKVFAIFIQKVPPSTWDNFYYFCEIFLPKYLKVNFPGNKLYKISDLITYDNLYDVYLSLISSWDSSENIVLKTNYSKFSNSFEFSEFKLNDNHQLMYLDSINYLPNDILVKVDRAAMASSLETRIPLLDHRVVEFAWKTPLEMKLRNKQSKWILRQVLKRYIPENLVEGPKKGFDVPIAKWLRGPLKDWANELLDEKMINSQQYLLSSQIRKKWNAHLSGKYDWSKQLWTVLMFQAWLNKK